MQHNKWMYLAAIAVAAAATVFTGRVQAALLLLFLAAAGLSSVLLWVLSLRKISLTMEVADISVAGRHISVALLLRHAGRLPLGPVVVNMKYHNLVFDTANEQEIFLEPGKEKRLEYILPYTSEDCGKTRLTMSGARLYDCLGIVSAPLAPASAQDIIINPALRKLAIKMQNPVSARSTGVEYDLMKKGQDPSETFDVRDYRAGDSMHSIHWKLSGKFDRLVVREFGDPINYQTALLYDLTVSEALSPQEKRRLQNAVLQMTASVSRALLENGYPHHLLTIDDGKEHETFIGDNPSYYTMLAEMMCRRVQTSQEQQELQLQSLQQAVRFSKIVLVCAELNSSYRHSIAVNAGMTVLYLQLEGDEQLEKEGNLMISRIRVDYFREKMQAIEL